MGLAFEKGLSDDLSLASELVYSKQGSSIDNVSSGEYITHFDYLALPVFVRYSPGGKNVFFQAGGKFGYLVNDKEIYTYNNTESNLDHLRQWDAGVLGGIGYRIGKHVVVDARYYYGLTPLIKKHTVLDPVTLETYFLRSRQMVQSSLVFEPDRLSLGADFVLRIAHRQIMIGRFIQNQIFRG